MARILIIDNNPDTQKALSGLLKYRTQHAFTVACSCQEGAHQALSQHPDLILINALLFMHNTYAFPRLMQQHKQTASISFLVYSPVLLGEITHRQIETSGVAGVIELPMRADELDAEIQKAIARHRPAKKTGVQPVSWQKIAKQSPAKPATQQNKQIKSVQWPVVAKKETPANSQQNTIPQKAVVRDFQSPSSVGPQTKKGKTFQQSTFRQIDTAELSHVKGKPKNEFQIQNWERVAPDRVKRRKPKRD